MNTVEINLKTLCAISKCASGKCETGYYFETRYYLMGVYIEVYPTHILAVATDGHKMLVCKMPVEPNNVEFRGIVPSDLLRKFKFRNYDTGAALFSLDNGDIRIECDGLTISVKPIDRKFPDWKKIIPADDYEIMAAKFSPKYLKTFEIFSKKTNSGSPTIAPNDQGAAIVRFENTDEVFGVLMPIRANLVPKTPDWFENKSAKSTPVQDATE